MFKLNQKGLSLVQALVTLALLSGIGLMTMQISEKQAIHQKRLKAKADLENFISGLTQVLTSDQVCNQVIANIPGGALATTPGAEDDPGLRRIIDPVAGIRDQANNFVYGTVVANINENITINNVSVGPALAGGPRLQAVDLWINYTKTGIGNIGFNAAPAAAGGGPVVDNFKLDNVLTVELDPANVITKCYTNVDAIDSGIIAACQMIGGAIVAGPPRRCDLGNAVSPNDGLSISELENQYTTLENWADGRFVSLSGEATRANISAQKFVISQNPPINGTGNEALNYRTAQDIMADPQAAGINLCPAGTLGIINGGVITCLAPGAFMCPANQRMMGINGSGSICANIITGNDTGCPAGQIGTLELVGGAIEFKCTKVNVEFNCTPSGWTGGNNPCGATYGACTSGSATFGEPACCFNPPTGSCSSGLTSYTCNYAGGGWTSGGACGSETPDCSTTAVVADGSVACCISSPNPVKCPSPTNSTYTCDFATGWSSAGASCGATTGACTSGTPADGDTACCASAPTTSCNSSKRLYECVSSGGWVDNGACSNNIGDAYCTGSAGPALGAEGACCSAIPRSTCGSGSNVQYTCNTLTSRWERGSNCGSTTSNCTSGTPAHGETACCPGGSPPTTTCAPASCKPNGRSCSGIADCNTCCNKPCADSEGSCSHGGVCGGVCRPNLRCSSGGTADNCPGDVAWGTGASCSGGSPTVYNPYRCNGTNWVAASHSCGGGQSGPCTTGTGVTGAVACCTSTPPAAGCTTPPPTYNPYRCDGTNWVAGSHGCGGSQSGPCSSGSGVSGTLACCTSTPSTNCGLNLGIYRCNSGRWSTRGGSCSTASGSRCGSSGSVVDGGNVCCASTPTSTCQGGGGGTSTTRGGGGCSTTYTCTGGADCIGGCPGTHGCSVYAGNCSASAPAGTCVAICTTAGNHSCYQDVGGSQDYAGRACF